jgi:hypothetical protein
MLQFVEITKKYGVTGVLACWLWMTNSRVAVLEAKLEHCYQLQMLKGNINASITYNKSVGILEDKFKIKRA